MTEDEAVTWTTPYTQILTFMFGAWGLYLLFAFVQGRMEGLKEAVAKSCGLLLALVAHVRDSDAEVTVKTIPCLGPIRMSDRGKLICGILSLLVLYVPNYMWDVGSPTALPNATDPNAFLSANVASRTLSSGHTYGGDCTCPDGYIYHVGARDNTCNDLMCDGGLAGKCNKQEGPWSNWQVTCKGPSQN